MDDLLINLQTENTLIEKKINGYAKHLDLFPFLFDNIKENRIILCMNDRDWDYNISNFFITLEIDEVISYCLTVLNTEKVFIQIFDNHEECLRYIHSYLEL